MSLVVVPVSCWPIPPAGADRGEGNNNGEVNRKISFSSWAVSLDQKGSESRSIWVVGVVIVTFAVAVSGPIGIGLVTEAIKPAVAVAAVVASFAF